MAKEAEEKEKLGLAEITMRPTKNNHPKTPT
jgi:hypothetical protein